MVEKTDRELAKGMLRQLAFSRLERYGPGLVCMYMNTNDRIEWEAEFGEDLDPKVDGVPLVDDFRHPEDRINFVYLSYFYEEQSRYYGVSVDDLSVNDFMEEA